MMKLKHLFGNEDLAKMLLGNWLYDESSVDMFRYFRISSNAVYPFKSNGETQFLRFAPTSEKVLNNVLAEIEFLDYLQDMKYSAVEDVISKNNRNVEVVQTPWGEYLSVVFKGVPGKPINEIGSDDNVVFGYGKSLGKLHKLSSVYEPKVNKRWSWRAVLDWTHQTLSAFPDETLALQEIELLNDYLSALPVTNKNFGLIHYDFETDNVFFNKLTDNYHIIDFDDSMYHWFVMDIEQALDSLNDDVEQEKYEQAEKCFINGYRSEFDVSDDMLSFMPAFRRFANLYSYARILRAMSETWSNEPDWMVNLRNHLNKAIKGRSANFGKQI